MEKEEWKKIKGFRLYYVSDWGNVYSVRSGRNLNPYPDAKGYFRVTLCKNKKSYSKKVHKLIEEAFLPPCPPGKEINHKDGIKANNRADNFEYIIHSENLKHAYKHGLQKPSKGNAKLNWKKVRKIRRLLGRGYTQVYITKRFKIHRSTVARIWYNKTWKEDVI